MHRSMLLLFSLTFAVATSAYSQAPKITKKGDPSVRDDTIYKLAVDPARYPEDAAIVLLDDGVVRYDADGRGTTTFRMVVQILRQDAVDNYQEHRFGHSPGHQKLTLNWIRVVKPDGQIISDRPSQEQDSDVPAPVDVPIYQERRVKRLSLSGVAVNTIVDYSYTIEELKPFRPGDFHQSWSVHMGMPVRRSRLLVDLPASMKPRIVERNLDFKRQEKGVGGRKVYTWARNDVPRFRSEPFAADSDGVRMSLGISSPDSWADVGDWYAGLARDRYTMTPAVVAKVREVVASARTRDDTIRAVHRWVAQDIRYVSISLGLGGYQPRTPATVLQTGFGDCKDKATIFVAALRQLGIRSYPVLLDADGGVEKRLPSITQFDHAIAAIESPRGGYIFTDLTSELTPYGSLPPASQGEFALVVKDNGTEEVTLPLDPIARNRSTQTIVGTVTADGKFDGRVEIVAEGSRQYSLRDAFLNPLDSAARANTLRHLGSSIFPGGTADSLMTMNGRDLSITPKFAWRVRGARAIKTTGGSAILDVPTVFGEPWEYEANATMLEQRGARQLPINAAQVHGHSETLTEMRLELPEGWRAQLPKNVTAVSAFGGYRSEYAQEGRVLRVLRSYSGVAGVHPPDKVGELIEWLRTVAQDDVRYILIDRPGTKK